ncbi:diguanylate cyclase [Acidobacteria bacterium AB60]|nr:diguanylate cyclase [Acidobacteria bacterium AB60]
MSDQSQLTILLASGEPALLRALEPILLATGARVSIALSAEAALASMLAGDPPSLALLDEHLPGMSPLQVLAAVHAEEGRCAFPILLIADRVTADWMERIRLGVVDDVVPRRCEAPFWQLRIDLALRCFHKTREADTLRNSLMEHSQFDELTGAYNRATLLSLLFRETDRAVRSGTSLCGILFDIDDFGHWNARLGSQACDSLLIQSVVRIHRLLRSYDLLGRMGSDDFLAVLPGCSPINAVLLAERLRDSFAEPVHVAGTAVRLSACFAVAASQGRSPVVLLRELQGALSLARETGPETIQSATDCPAAQSPPVAFLSSGSDDDLLAW